MTSASLSLSRATEKIGGAVFFEMHSVPERVSQTRLRRFSTVGLARDPATIFVYLTFAVTGMTFFLGHSQLRRLECLNGVHSGDVHKAQLRAFRNDFLLGCSGLDDGTSSLSLDVKSVWSAVGWQSESVIARWQRCAAPVSLKWQRELAVE